MTSKVSLEWITQNGLCMGCGFCLASYRDEKGGTSLEMVFDAELDSFVPRLRGLEGGESSREFICPGASLNMNELSLQVHNKLPEDYVLGVHKALKISHATDSQLRERAASGGLIPAIITQLFDSKQIDAVYMLDPGEGAYDAKGVLLESPGELSKMHGSVYHPFNYGAQLKRLIDSNLRFAFVGLPCQIAGLEMLKRTNSELASRHVFSVGLFCGGVNTFKGIAYYLNGFDVSWDEVRKIKYREGPWPGKIKVTLKNGQEKLIPRIRGNSRWKILRYVIAFQGYWMQKRCRLCPDQVSDFADIAVGDPHLPEIRDRGGAGFSAVIVRTERGSALLSDLENSGRVSSESVSRENIIKSQGYTLDNRRHVLAAMKVNSFLGGKNPELSVYPQVSANMGFRHYRYAFVDLLKLVLPKNRFYQTLYIPWQIFEYLFITLTPTVILQRFKNLLRNK